MDRNLPTIEKRHGEDLNTQKSGESFPQQRILIMQNNWINSSGVFDTLNLHHGDTPTFLSKGRIDADFIISTAVFQLLLLPIRANPRTVDPVRKINSPRFRARRRDATLDR